MVSEKMGNCITCAHWYRRSRGRGRCKQRGDRGFGAMTSADFSCDEYERRVKQASILAKTKLELHDELVTTRRELRLALGKLARVDADASREGLLASAGRLSLVDVQWLRGELASVVALMVADAVRGER